MKKLFLILLASLILQANISAQTKYSCCFNVIGDFVPDTDCLFFDSKEECEGVCKSGTCAPVAGKAPKEKIFFN